MKLAIVKYPNVSKIFLALGLWLISNHSSLAAPNPFGELAEFFGSAAGRIVAREMGLSAETRALLASGKAMLSPDDAEQLVLGVRRIRLGYLKERPQDELIFESEAEADEPIYLRPKQDALLHSTFLGEAASETKFVEAGDNLRGYRSRADAFLAGADGAPLPIALPPRIEVAIDKERAQILFKFALDTFSGGFDPERIRAILEPIRSGNLASLTPEVRLELKSRRKEASILRSAFVILGDEHEVPAALHAYTRDFGKLNDAIENEIADLIPGLARDLRRSMDADKIRVALKSFEPAGRGSFDRYLGKLVSGIRVQALQKALPVEEFHEMRKSLKELMTFLDLSERLGTDPGRKAAYDFLFGLNEELGLMHDELVGGSLRGEIKYKKQKLELPERIRGAILDFLGRVTSGS